MAERIVQLRTSEYEELVNTAELKEKQIIEKAQELWRTKGAATIDITIRTERDTCGTLTFDCKTQVWYKDGRFFIPQELRNRLNKFLKREIESEIESFYGNPMELYNCYKKKMSDYNKYISLVWLAALSGWVVAACVLGILCRG